MSDAEERAKSALGESSHVVKAQAELSEPTARFLRDVMRQEIAGGVDEAMRRLSATDEGKARMRELGALLFQGAREAAKAETKQLVFDTWWTVTKRTLQIALLAAFFLPVFGKSTGYELAWKIIVGGVAK